MTRKTRLELERENAGLHARLAALEAQQSRLPPSQPAAQLPEAVKDIIIAVDRTGRYIFANQAYLDYRNLRWEDLAGRQIADLIGQSTFASTIQQHLETCLQGRAFEVTFEQDFPTLGRRMITFTLNPLLGEGAQVQGALVVARDVTEIHLQVARLQESEARWQTALESVGDGIWDLDLVSNKAVNSDQLISMLGYDPSDPIFQDNSVWSNLVHPDDLSQFFQVIQAFAGGLTEKYSNEFRVRCQDGSYRWILARGHAIKRGPDGKPTRVIGTHTDVTARRQLEDALREREERLRLISDNMTEMVSLHAVDGTTLFVTPSVATLTGYTQAEIVGVDPFQWIHPQDLEQVLLPVHERAIVEQTSALVTYRTIKKDGNFRWVESTIRPILDETGSVAYLQSSTHDITERKHAQELFETAFIHSPVMLAITTITEGIVVDINEACTQTFGYTKEEWVGKSASLFLDDTQWTQRRQMIETVLANGVIHNQQVRMKTRTGRWIDGLLSMNLIHLAEQPHLMLSLVDITERRQVENALQEREEHLSLITDNMTDMVALHKPDGSFLYASPSADSVIGYSLAELLSMSPYEYIHPDDAEKLVRPSHQTHMPLGKTSQVTYRVRHKNGEYYWLETIARPIMDELGQLAYIQTVSRDITERKQAEDLFQKVFNATNVYMAILSTKDLRIVDVNYAACTFTGMKRRKLLGKPFMELITHEANAYLINEVKKYADEQEAHSPFTEVTYRVTDGREVNGIMSINSTVVGNEPVLLVSFIDLSDQKKLERKLRDSEQSLREAQRLAKIGSWVSDFVKDKLTWSDEAYQIFEVEKDEPSDLRDVFAEMVFPEEREILTNQINDAIQNHQGFDYVHRILLAGDRIKYIHERGETVYSQDGIPLRVVGTAQDITEQVLARQLLEKSQDDLQMFKTVIEQSTEAIAISDQEGRFLYINPAHTKLFGRSQAEALALNFRDYYPPESVAVLNDIVMPALARDSRWTGILDVLDVNGRRFPLWQEAGVLRDEQGNIQYAIGLMHDDSERIQAELELRAAKEQAEFANQAKSDFLAMISHEIRTPMNAILGFTRLLEGKLSDPLLKSYLAPIQISGETLIALINDILDLSRIEAGKLSVQFRPVLLRAVFADVEKFFALRAAEKQLELISAIDPAIPGELMLDEIRLRQVLVNLVGNAIKYTDQGYVVLSARLLAQRPGQVDLEIAVEDSGSGISPEDQDHIFDVFNRLGGQNKVGSTGLGLAISQRLVNLMKGEINLKSSEAHGTIFEVILTGIDVSPAAELDFTGLVKEFDPIPLLQFDLPPSGSPDQPDDIFTNHPPKKLHPCLPDTVLETLQTQFLPLWEQFRDLQPVDSLRRFSSDLAALGEKYECTHIVDYAANLLAAIDLFDIEAIDRLLGQFPGLIYPSGVDRRSQA